MKKTTKQLIVKLTFFLFFSLTAKINAMSQTNPTPMKLLIHITSGTENPTKAALAFLVARTAVEEGNTVTLFLAGDAVQLIRDNVLDNLSGLGTGKLRDHMDVLIKAGTKIYLSGNSSKARGVTEVDIANKNAEFALPTVLIKLIRESDKNITY